MSEQDELVLVGRIAATHGLRGELRTTLNVDDLEGIRCVEALLLKGGEGQIDTVHVASVAPHGKKSLLRLKGISSINEVLHLVGREIYLRRSQLPAPADDEYYWHDLIGMTVVTTDGERLGEIRQIFATGSNDVFVVATQDGELLLPATEEVVQQIDYDRSVMTVALLEGLRDL
jgi:16S rRNA processing protein RimM